MTPDFIIMSSDSHVDIPINGTAIIHRLLESKGYRVKIVDEISDDTLKEKITAFGKPRLGFLLTSGIMDSTLYAKPGQRAGRKTVKWSKEIKKKYPKTPIIVGGLESSIRRLAHYDMFIKKVAPSIMIDMDADVLVYGMGERQILEIAERLEQGKELKGIQGTVWKTDKKPKSEQQTIYLPTYEEVKNDEDRFIDSFNEQARNTDPFRSKRLIEKYESKKCLVIQETPAVPLTPKELDYINELPYTRQPYTNKSKKKIPADMMEQAVFSVVTHRGCFGGCNFCTIKFHQGKTIISRIEKSILKEVKNLVKRKEFKGTIFLVSPSGNMYGMRCKMQTRGGKKLSVKSVIDGKKISFEYDPKFHCEKSCLPGPCVNLETNFDAFRKLLREIKNVTGVKNIEIVGGFVYDLLMKDPEMIRYLLKEEIKIIVAREHTDNKVLRLMNRPKKEEYEKFQKILKKISEETGYKPELTDYMILKHPGADKEILPEGVETNELKPLPMTTSGVMHHTGKDLKKKHIKNIKKRSSQ